MMALIEALTGDLGKWVAGLVAGLIALAGVYLRGRSDGKAKLRLDAEKAYRETREKMDAVDTGDNPHVSRQWLSERGRAKR